MLIHTPRWRVAAAVLVGSFALAACDDSIAPPRPFAGDADIALELSSLMADPGERVAVGIRVDGFGAKRAAALQGRLQYDASRLRYVGQSLDEALVLVNDAQAGELRISSTDVDGFDARAAVLVFEVRGRQYAAGLRYEHEELANTSVDAMSAEVLRNLKVSRELAMLNLSGARRMSVADWVVRLDDRRDGGKVDGVDLTPGQYLLNLRFGDSNLSGGITAGDALAVAQVSVGLREAIVGSAAPSIDVAIAGNVTPFNLPGLGEPGDALAPGVNTDGTRTLTSSDVLAIRQEAVGINPAVAGELIPGRGPLATNRVQVPAGDITTSTTWSAANIYELQGIVRFTGGAVLTIEPGTRIEGVGLQTGGILSALFIARDATIQANGTYLQPITFTCAGVEPKPKGCWGGVWIAGNAHVNEGDAAQGPSPVVPGRSDPGGCNQRVGEATTPQLQYGGCNDNDNSGVLRYAIIEFAGWTVALNVELNGLTMGGVGSGTQIDHIQVHGGQDDGVELFGGTVNLSHLYLTANSDDNFDISFGWNGSAQFISIVQDPNDGDKGLEADNTETAGTFGNTPRTNGQIWNVTFVGASSGAGANASNDAIHVRRGTGPFLSNWLVANARVGMDLDDEASTCVALNAAGGLNVRNSIFAAAVNLGNNDAEVACGPYAAGTEGEEAMINDAANANSVVALTASDILFSPIDKLLPDMRPRPGQATGGATPPNNGFLDVTATFIGAVPPKNSTGSNIPWYSGWTRSWFSATQP